MARLFSIAYRDGTLGKPLDEDDPSVRCLTISFGEGVERGCTTSPIAVATHDETTRSREPPIAYGSLVQAGRIATRHQRRNNAQARGKRLPSHARPFPCGTHAHVGAKSPIMAFHNKVWGCFRGLGQTPVPMRSFPLSFQLSPY